MIKASAEIHDLPLPLWAYVPGRDEDADHATLAKAKTLLPVRFENDVPADHPVVRYGLTLNDAGFFWEAHEILEAIWKLAPQGGRDRILLRACIQIANANLKLKMERLRAVERLLHDAQAELDELCVRSAGRDSGGFAERFDAVALAFIVRRRLDGIGAMDGPICFGFA
jgi:hypothetical protein